MSTVPWAGNHHIASRKILLVQNFMEIPTDPPEEIFKVFIFVEREAFKPYLNKWLPCLFLNTCEPGTVTVTVKIDVDKAKSQVATTIGYGRESTGCKYDKEPSCAHSNFTHTQSTMDRHHTNTHACVCTQWHHQNFWTGRFFFAIYIFVVANQSVKIKSLHPAKISRYTVLHLIHSLCEFLILGWVIDT